MESCRCVSSRIFLRCQSVASSVHSSPLEQLFSVPHRAVHAALSEPWHDSEIEENQKYCTGQTKTLSLLMVFTLCCDLSSCMLTVMPVGRWIILTALSVVFTDCPPALEKGDNKRHLQKELLLCTSCLVSVLFDKRIVELDYPQHIVR